MRFKVVLFQSLRGLIYPQLSELGLTLIRMAGEIQDLVNFEQVPHNIAWSTIKCINILESYLVKDLIKQITFNYFSIIRE